MVFWVVVMLKVTLGQTGIGQNSLAILALLLSAYEFPFIASGFSGSDSRLMSFPLKYPGRAQDSLLQLVAMSGSILRLRG